jgi:DNA (cytosine-5)-methyltransferase 1
MSRVYYNEIDPFAAAWLRELIQAKLIAEGEVDERSIEKVEANDLRGFRQCHFFAGVGVWSYALRNAGWRDEEPVWTGSCPCPPFSSAGKQKACPQCNSTNPVPHVGRTGYFVCCFCDHEWFADARHLWPEMWRLISLCRPDKFFGEQVAGDDGRTWLASVRASLEILGYAVGAKDICSAGVGASDLRQRLYFVAAPKISRDRAHQREPQPSVQKPLSTGRRGVSQLVVNASTNRCRHDLHQSGSHVGSDGPQPKHEHADSGVGNPIATRNLDYTHSPRLQGRQFQLAYSEGGEESHGPTSESGTAPVGTLAESNRLKSGDGEVQRSGRLLQLEENPLTGFWSNAEWIYCRDGKYRAVKPGTFPLAHGTAARVGRLRGYGNAINAEVAKTFIEAYLNC